MEGHVHGMMYMGNYDCAGNYMHDVMRIGKRVSAKVRNYDLKDLDNEMNRKA